LKKRAITLVELMVIVVVIAIAVIFINTGTKYFGTKYTITHTPVGQEPTIYRGCYAVSEEDGVIGFYVDGREISVSAPYTKMEE